MPKAWSEKDERQYQHIKTSVIRRGRSATKAEEIAARTVNKQLRTEHRTPNTRTQRTGNPTTSLKERTRDEVYNRAKELAIPGRSAMTRAELIAAIHSRG